MINIDQPLQNVVNDMKNENRRIERRRRGGFLCAIYYLKKIFFLLQ
jgi:hypothetical protein